MSLSIDIVTGLLILEAFDVELKYRWFGRDSRVEGVLPDWCRWLRMFLGTLLATAASFIRRLGIGTGSLSEFSCDQVKLAPFC